MTFYAVRLDETEYFTDPDLIKRAGGKIWTVYLYTDAERTHCCEFTPSYWLEPVEHWPEALPEDDAERERLSGDLIDCMSYDGIYVHCHRIDGIKAAPYPFVTIDGRTPWEYERVYIGDYDDYDEAREAYQGNPVY